MIFFFYQFFLYFYDSFVFLFRYCLQAAGKCGLNITYRIRGIRNSTKIIKTEHRIFKIHLGHIATSSVE
jgi:hypothetical protein